MTYSDNQVKNNVNGLGLARNLSMKFSGHFVCSVTVEITSYNEGYQE